MNEVRHKLPRWRTIAGFAVFLGLFADLGLLAPVYYRNYELDRYIKGRLHTSGAQAVPDDRLRTELAAQAKSLGLPLVPNDIHIQHRNGVTELASFYKIQVDLGLYTVDLHFRPEASSR